MNYEVRKKSVIKGEVIEVDERYKPLKRLGSGAYGCVVSAEDMKTGEKVAIKKVKDCFHNLTDAKRILREIKLLRHLDHPNIIKLKDMVNPLSMDRFDDVYLIMECMQADLHKIIYSENELSEPHMAFIVYQVLCGLKYMHSANIIHRDLKPGNILINSDCTAKICDLGLGRGMEEREDGDMTEYVVTRWYRAPEVVVSAKKYTQAIDIWAIGCIFAEMLAKQPLFQGEDYVDQLRVIFRVIGTPSEDDLSCVLSPDALTFIGRIGVKKPKDLSKLFPNASPDALDLLSQMLKFNPAKRITVEDALRHPFFARFYNESFVNETSVCRDPVDVSYEDLEKSRPNLQRMMYEEILHYRPDAQLDQIIVSKRGSGKFSILGFGGN